MIEYINNTLYSSKFDDIYFNTYEPLKECKYAYSSALEQIDNDEIVVAEAGFGTGLNLFCTIEKFKTLNKKSLHYIAVEKYPFSKDELTTIYRELGLGGDIYDEFLDSYYIIKNSLLRIYLLNSTIIVDLYFGDILEFLDECEFRADIWYLDGFAPSKNPQMWSEEFLSNLAAYSSENAVIRSFSCARVVRDRLSQNGFEVSKIKGYHKKREMLQAICVTPKSRVKKEIWFEPPKIAKPKSVLVVGAGIAGLSIATLFSKAGFDVIVAESASSSAQGASSNLAGVCAPLITQPGVILGDMHISSFLLSRQFYKRFGGEFVDFCGCDEYLISDKMAAKFNHKSEFFTIFNDIYPRANIDLAMQIMPKNLSQSLASKLNICYGYEYKSLKYQNGSYEVEFNNLNIIKADLVIFANGNRARELFLGEFNDPYMQLSSVRGQTTLVSEFIKLDRPLSARGYITKAVDKIQLIGASYARGDEYALPRSSDDDGNLALVSEFIDRKDIDIIGSNVGFRGYSGDRFPIIGGVHNASRYMQIYSSLLWTKGKLTHQDPIYHPNILISAAHGSRGLSTAIMGANILLDMVLGRQICVKKSILHALNPSRFLVRKLKKGLVKPAEISTN
ncbi:MULTISPECIES: bifunctional tRNA (5-methylaminomethyl-2-thiouridine)(34)-methyltransferase MnmD/FAD-dependent 5-carboxymethylaminomethyl-2-thiouridine(34) oxidoreductase MnmC [Campylobacter]|uniref:bifunctional tRNA (5-methylaminomethyl-2-thiouridine)(34)-methyltransferase MnmD/FAD-dependent 5-carboxymethylaminomethyl-2-thiouridine(34) oxidoreductase MnmC n=1 Tax=Campylobacter TaxID=194 RepID=UPI000A34BD13|nr:MULTISPECIES: bifunctional tRNA (5-methylaminomethyl-2-thiouridine)(34)-methyltransferase MnmD/FAD-dependent 5-carboxymethylaminomethyl-2-thiouridine(34) oxidoreductase MnmC [unclassified Campylobacter]MCR8696405.1 bifunctional tRNA (5-methylaminomethyl-2-thiouridine)(34)-methyltransferase MnmD/FAD-dependent 5-carboxymethylaminomethyl-2-thiouridine(34) oxidoreductase MnmC [Campylobacter sp. RM19073]